MVRKNILAIGYVHCYTFDNSSYGPDRVFSRLISCHISRRCTAHDSGSVGTPGGLGPRTCHAPAASRPGKIENKMVMHGTSIIKVRINS